MQKISENSKTKNSKQKKHIKWREWRNRMKKSQGLSEYQKFCGMHLNF